MVSWVNGMSHLQEEVTGSVCSVFRRRRQRGRLWPRPVRAAWALHHPAEALRDRETPRSSLHTDAGALGSTDAGTQPRVGLRLRRHRDFLRADEGVHVGNRVIRHVDGEEGKHVAVSASAGEGLHRQPTPTHSESPQRTRRVEKEALQTPPADVLVHAEGMDGTAHLPRPSFCWTSS